MKISCPSCNAVLFVRKCSCGRNYILTTAHTEIRRRDHTAKPIEESDAEKIVEHQDLPVAIRTGTDADGGDTQGP